MQSGGDVQTLVVGVLIIVCVVEGPTRARCVITTVSAYAVAPLDRTLRDVIPATETDSTGVGPASLVFRSSEKPSMVTSADTRCARFKQRCE